MKINDMTNFIEITRNILGLEKTGKGEGDIDNAEKRLGIEIPQKVKAFYNALDGDYKLMLDNKKWKLLPPDKLYVNENVLVFSQHGKKRAEYRGIDLSNGKVMYRYTDYEWSEEDDYGKTNKSFCTLMTEGVALTTILKMPVNRYYKLFSKDSPFAVEKDTASLWKSYKSYSDETYNRILINEETKSIAWARGFCFSPDIYIGSQSDEVIYKFREIKQMDKLLMR